MHGKYVTDLLKMCMMKLNAERIIFDNFTGFDLHIAGVYCKNCCQFFVFPAYSLCPSPANSLCLSCIHTLTFLHTVFVFPSLSSSFHLCLCCFLLLAQIVQLVEFICLHSGVARFDSQVDTFCLVVSYG